ncbi:helix-turn-helix transcriptional regulator [Micromonospora sp. URMC 103]|uniref:helix-turn-helix transcriptional regulator n=1 Tax=Micromonospora sp. URMC 103 TaxID=3423406 RepID=UPI003F1B0F94
MSSYVNPTEQTSDTTTNIAPAAVAPVASEVWTVERVRALGVTTTLATAASVLGISRSQAYRLAATNAFPAPLIRAGSRIIVPVAGLLQLLLLDKPAPADGGRRLEPDAKVSVDATTPPPADSTHHRWRHRPEHPGDDE